MFDKLTSVESRYDELMTRIGTVELAGARPLLLDGEPPADGTPLGYQH